MKKRCLDTRDFQGKQIIFTEKKRLQKLPYRPDLGDPAFIRRINKAIQAPDFVYTDFERPKTRRACYLVDKKTKSRTKYTKVVIDIGFDPRYVVTAYRTDYVKERKKKTCKCIYGKYR